MSENTLYNALQALQDVIRSAQSSENIHDPSPSEYFALLSTTLVASPSTANLPEFLKILIAVIPKSSKVLVQSQFKELSYVLLNIIKTNADQSTLLYLAISALSAVMLQQDNSEGFWSNLQSLQCINALLNFIDDSRPRIRKLVHHQLTTILLAHKKNNAIGIRLYINDFCIEILRSCTRADHKRCLSVIHFLEQALNTIPPLGINKLIDLSINLEICKIPKLTSSVYRMIDSFFQSPYQSSQIDLIQRIYSKLIQSTPSSTDMETNVFYSAAIASGFNLLYKLNHSVALPSLNTTLQTLINILDSEFSQVHCGIGAALKRIITTIDKKHLFNQTSSQPTSSSIGFSHPVIEMVTAAFEQMLELKYKSTWVHELDALRSLFEKSSHEQSCVLLLQSVIIKLGTIHQSFENNLLTTSDPIIPMTIRSTLSAAFRVCGMRTFLAILPLESSSTSLIADEKEWIIPFLFSELKNVTSSFSEFGEIILPLARKYKLKFQALNEEDESVAKPSSKRLKTNYRMKIIQLWNLFPELCLHIPNDFVASFTKMSTVLVKVLQDSEFPELFHPIISGISRLAEHIYEKVSVPQTNTNLSNAVMSQEYQLLASQSSVFIPLLLSYLDTLPLGDSNLQVGLRGVVALIKVSSSSITSNLVKQILQQLLNNTAGAGVQSGLTEEGAAVYMSILRNLIPILPNGLVILVYRTVRPLLSNDEAISLQKRAYALLHALLINQSSTIYAFESRLTILELISQSLMMCHVSSRNMRLKCIEALIASSDIELPEMESIADRIINEILVCQYDPNKKTRDGSTIIFDIFTHRIDPMRLLTLLCKAILGDSTTIRAAALQGISTLLRSNRDRKDLLELVNELLPTVCLLLQEETNDQTKAVMTFLRVCVSTFPLEMLESNLPLIVESFTSRLGSIKIKFVVQSRGIMRKLYKKVGYETLQGIVPDTDMALLDYVARQDRRIKRRDVNNLEGNRSSSTHIASESDSESDDIDHPSYGGMEVDRSADTLSKMNQLRNGIFSENYLLDVIKMDVDAEEESESVDGMDYRLKTKNKAVRAKDINYGPTNIPTTLNDLLEDQNPKDTMTSNPSGNSDNLEGEGNAEPYSVVVTSDGKVVIKENVKDPSNGMNPSDLPLILGAKEASKPVDGDQTWKKFDSKEAGKNKKRKLKEPGIEYRSKKGAGGDVWKKGMLEPHAYIPLDPRMLSKKNQKEAIEHFGIVIKNGRKVNKGKPLKGKRSR